MVSVLEKDQTQEIFEKAEVDLMKALAKLDGTVSGAIENIDRLKKEVAEKKNQEVPLLSNMEIKNLQEENKKLQKEKEEARRALEAERAKNEKLVKLKLDVSGRIENLIEQLEKVA